jgi:hypothetical protein
MFAKNDLPDHSQRTEDLPAQEMIFLEVVTAPALTAEQAYAQRNAESKKAENGQNLGFVP